MTKKILKIISVIFLFLLLLISYLSFFGIKTEVFNNEIKDSLSKINKEVKININEVSYLLNPLNFNLDITTENSEVLLKKHQLDLEKVKLNVSIKSLFKKKLLINKIKLSTKEVDVYLKLNQSNSDIMYSSTATYETLSELKKQDLII